MRVLCVWSVLVLIPLGVGGQCPVVISPCYCLPSHSEVSIVCDNLDSFDQVLESIVGAENGTVVKSLSISNTPLPSLPPHAFPRLHIRRLILIRNTLSDFDEKAFDGPLLDSLEELNVENNHLVQIPQKGVSKLKKLRKLILRNNKISSLPNNVFQNYASKGSLEKLELTKNSLGNIGTTTPFRGLTSLKELSLSGNYLTEFPTTALKGLRQSLEDLDLGLNQISRIPLKSFHLPHLKSLSLEYNNLLQLQPQVFRGCGNLIYLFLTGALKFPDWNSEWFRYVPKVQVLAIGDNPLRSIPSDAFKYLPGLVGLEMTEAGVQDVAKGAFRSVPNLQSLTLNKNKLTKITRDMFDGLVRLYTLDLAHNEVKEVEEGAFGGLPQLRHVDLSHNRLSSLHPKAFFRHSNPTPTPFRDIYLCDNPWFCDQKLSSLRDFLRKNSNIKIDTPPDCFATCGSKGVRLRAPDIPFTTMSPTTQKHTTTTTTPTTTTTTTPSTTTTPPTTTTTTPTSPTTISSTTTSYSTTTTHIPTTARPIDTTTTTAPTTTTTTATTTQPTSTVRRGTSETKPVTSVPETEVDLNGLGGALSFIERIIASITNRIIEEFQPKSTL